MEEQENKYKPFSMSRMLSVFHCEAEAEREGNLVRLWEPLHYNEELTERDKPHWEDEKIVFYRPEQHAWVHVNRHLMFRWGGDNTVLILPLLPEGPCAGAVVEVTGAQVRWRRERWFIRWHGYTNSRAARMVAAGIEWYRDPDKPMPLTRDASAGTA